ncbi:MAG TPA: threonine--tRNA ligase [Armatimonadota bacterium]|nr:threonine--tRNA ligase [Armatimonadota bacterium]
MPEQVEEVEKAKKEADDLYRIRHSCAHVMAQAVVEIFPDAQLAIGPPIEDRFYYDFLLPRSLTPEDLTDIEERMKRIIKGNSPFEKWYTTREEAIQYFEERDQPFKVEIIRDLPEEGVEDGKVSFYRQDQFTDLCKGPHVRRTGEIRAYKLLNVAGAYWRGDEHRPMLQRIYGTAWKTRADLDAYLQRLEEARARDHRRLGKELELFAGAPEIGAGLPLWLPKGAALRRVLQDYVLAQEERLGYQHVYTPVLGKLELYRTSGHLEHYKETMFPPIHLDHEDLQLRPMNCPHHFMVFRSKMRSYRELPLRIAELAAQFRYEKSGQLEGLSRVRQMTLNDAHIFCTPEQVKAEIVGVIKMIEEAYHDLGLTNFWYRLSCWDPAAAEKYVQDPEMWARAEQVLRETMDDLGISYQVGVGEAAFYGPKIDIQVPDVAGNDETLSTVQIDYVMPERFDLQYIGADAKPHRPIVVHRGVISTMERIVAFLIENFAGAFPVWLAPVQAVSLPIADRHADYAAEIVGAMKAKGVRAELDDRSEKLQYRIREAQLQKVPYMLVAGDQEVANRTVTIRMRTGENLPAMPLDEAVAFIAEKNSSRSLELGR